MRYDQLGNRMKEFEAQTTKIKLIPQLPVYARLDARAFHTFCKGLNKPFCIELVETMQEVTKYLIEATHAQLGYVQSDEISLCWLDPTKAPFDGKLFKLQSVLASMASSMFLHYITVQKIVHNFGGFKDMEYLESQGITKFANEKEEYKRNWEKWLPLYKKIKTNIPSFDCRVCQLPNETELANMFVWREIDAVRNSVQMLAQANFSHKSLQGLSAKELQNKLLTEKDINWNDLSSELKRGTYFKRVLVEKELDDETWNKIPDDKKPESRIVVRSEIQKYELPIMKSVKNKVGVYFYNEKPIEMGEAILDGNK